jgi:hypothetical protein
MKNYYELIVKKDENKYVSNLFLYDISLEEAVYAYESVVESNKNTDYKVILIEHIEVGRLMRTNDY